MARRKVIKSDSSSNLVDSRSSSVSRFILLSALRLVYQAARAVKIPVIGLGGIASGEDAAEFLIAGASAVAVGTATFWDPRSPSVRRRRRDLAWLKALVFTQRQLAACVAWQSTVVAASVFH